MISPGWERERDPKAKRPVHYSFNRYSYLDSVRRLKRQEREHRHRIGSYRSKHLRTRGTDWRKALLGFIDEMVGVLRKILAKEVMVN